MNANDETADDPADATPSSDAGEANEAAAPNSESGAEADVNPLSAPLAATTAERDKLKEQLVRTSADFENYRRRSRREIEDAKLRGKDEAIIELLPVFDNLERAVTAAKTAKDIESVIEGVRMVLKLFEDTAERIGLLRVPTLGERFDPAVHDAIQQVESADQPAGTILSEVAAGYRFGKRLIRAAMVVVARPPAAPKPEPVPEPASTSAPDATEPDAGTAAGTTPEKAE